MYPDEEKMLHNIMIFIIFDIFEKLKTRFVRKTLEFLINLKE
jgi:hypothetical protein